jgi:hypothetical protein
MTPWWIDMWEATRETLEQRRAELKAQIEARIEAQRVEAARLERVREEYYARAARQAPVKEKPTEAPRQEKPTEAPRQEKPTEAPRQAQQARPQCQKKVKEEYTTIGRVTRRSDSHWHKHKDLHPAARVELEKGHLEPAFDDWEPGVLGFETTEGYVHQWLKDEGIDVMH